MSIISESVVVMEKLLLFLDIGENNINLLDVAALEIAWRIFISIEHGQGRQCGFLDNYFLLFLLLRVFCLVAHELSLLLE